MRISIIVTDSYSGDIVNCICMKWIINLMLMLYIAGINEKAMVM